MTSFYIQKTNQQASQGNRPAHTITHKVQTQKAIKNYCKDESKAKASVSTSSQNSELSNKVKKDKKKKQHKAKQESSIPATRINAAQTGEPCQKKKKLWDLSMVTCFNYDKRGH